MPDTDTKRRIDIDCITLIDFRTGRFGHMAEKYRLQMLRYRTILQNLSPGSAVERHLLFMDKPQRIVMA
jgi:hypothetical protein